VQWAAGRRQSSEAVAAQEALNLPLPVEHGDPVLPGDDPANTAIAPCQRQASSCTPRWQLPELTNQIPKFNWNLTPNTFT
jgi:hypothetical protein